MFRKLKWWWKRLRCPHDGKFYVPVATYVGPTPWGYCCKCGHRELIENSHYRANLVTHDGRDLEFR